MVKEEPVQLGWLNESGIVAGWIPVAYIFNIDLATKQLHSYSYLVVFDVECTIASHILRVIRRVQDNRWKVKEELLMFNKSLDII